MERTGSGWDCGHDDVDSNYLHNHRLVLMSPCSEMSKRRQTRLKGATEAGSAANYRMYPSFNRLYNFRILRRPRGVEVLVLLITRG